MFTYLDSEGNEVQETIETNGTSASTETSKTGIRFIRAWVEECGTFNSNNTGGIIIEGSSSGSVVAFIGAGIGQTQLGMYTVPKGISAYLEKIHVFVASSKTVNLRMWQRQGVLRTSAPYKANRLVRQWTEVQGEIISEFVAKQKFPELTDLWIEGQSNQGTAEVEVDYDLVCTRN